MSKPLFNNKTTKSDVATNKANHQLNGNNVIVGSFKHVNIWFLLFYIEWGHFNNKYAKLSSCILLINENSLDVKPSNFGNLNVYSVNL